MTTLSNAEIEKLSETILSVGPQNVSPTEWKMARYIQTASAVVKAGRKRTEDHTLTYEKRPCICSLCEAIRAHDASRSEEHTSELQSLMRISYAVFCLNKKTHTQTTLTYSYIIM